MLGKKPVAQNDELKWQLISKAREERNEEKTLNIPSEMII